MDARTVLALLTVGGLVGTTSAQQTAPARLETPVPASQPAAAPPAATWSPAPAPVASTSGCGPLTPCDFAPSANTGRVWVEGEYLLWWMRGDSLPPLLTSSPAGTPSAQAGVLGAPGTTVLFGDSKTNGDLRSGFRITTGTWINEASTFGVEGSFLMLENKSAHISRTSDGSTILARPFTDANTGLTSSQRVAFPNDVTGSFDAQDAGGGLLGAGLLLRDTICQTPNFHFDILGGYRFLRFTDRIDINESITSVSTTNSFGVAPGTRIQSGDTFATKNVFNGFDAGVQAEYRRGSMSLNVLAKLAVGYNQQNVDIAGGTTVTVPGSGSVTNNGGLLALSSNIGHYSKDNDISVIPEFGVKLGYQVTPHLRASLGYTVLFWNNVVRAGDQIDTTVNTTLLPQAGTASGPARPTFGFQRTDLLTQGFDLGLEFRY